MRKLQLITTGILVLTAGLVISPAQENRVRTETRSAFFEGAAPAPGMQYTYEFVSKQTAFETRVVKGAPYSADAVTEVTQTLADGNRIHNTSKATLYRDSEGRTRREQTVGKVGPLVASGEPLQIIFINDPVAGTSFTLEPRAKVASRITRSSERTTAELKARVEKLAAEQNAGNVFHQKVQDREEGARESRQYKNESLGTQTVEGIACDGTRTTLTIPAGQIGNERPIDIVTERWYSPQLQTVVMTKTSDPRAGETVYRLTNIKLDEPPQALFTVPADYTVK